MADLVPFADDLLALIEARMRLDSIDPEAASDVLAKIKTRVADARKAAEGKSGSDKVARPVANRAADAVDGLRRALAQWFRHYDGYDPMFSWWMREPFRQADAALGEYVTFLRETLAGLKGRDDDTILGDPIGREGCWKTSAPR